MKIKYEKTKRFFLSHSFAVRDKFNFFLHLILWVVTTLDAYLTYMGMTLGGAEGNPIVKFMMQKMGVESALLLGWMITTFFIYLVYHMDYLYLRKFPKRKNFIYGITIIILLWRTLVVGGWIWMIGSGCL